MVSAIFLLCLTWGTLVLFFLLLVRIGAKPAPTPPSIESKSGWAHHTKTTKIPLHGFDFRFESTPLQFPLTSWCFTVGKFTCLPFRYKPTGHRERLNVQFRAEAFNVLNHTNFNNPASTSLTSGVYNQITSARDPRQLQLALKLIF